MTEACGLESQPVERRSRFGTRLVWSALAVLGVTLLLFVFGVVRASQQRAALIAGLERFEDAIITVSYEPYSYAPPVSIGFGDLFLGRGRRVIGYSLQSDVPWWARLMGFVVHEDTFAPIYEVMIHGDQFGDENVPLLLQCSDLRVLELDGTRITDEGVRRLAEHLSLVDVDLSRTSITDDSLQALDKISTLRELHIHDTKVSQAAVDAFRKRHPDCLVFH